MTIVARSIATTRQRERVGWWRRRLRGPLRRGRAALIAGTVVRIMCHPSFTRLTISSASFAVMLHSCAPCTPHQDLLPCRFDLRMVAQQSQRVCQVVGISQERSDSGCGGNLVHVGEPFYRFNHHRRQQSPSGLSGQSARLAFMLFRRQAPQPGCVAWTGAAGPLAAVLRIAPGRIPHVADSESGLLGRVHPVEEDPVQSHVERLLDHPGSSASGGKRAMSATFGWVPLFRTIARSAIARWGEVRAGISSGLCSMST